MARYQPSDILNQIVTKRQREEIDIPQEIDRQNEEILEYRSRASDPLFSRAVSNEDLDFKDLFKYAEDIPYRTEDDMDMSHINKFFPNVEMEDISENPLLNEASVDRPVESGRKISSVDKGKSIEDLIQQERKQKLDTNEEEKIMEMLSKTDPYGVGLGEEKNRLDYNIDKFQAELDEKQKLRDIIAGLTQMIAGAGNFGGAGGGSRLIQLAGPDEDYLVGGVKKKLSAAQKAKEEYKKNERYKSIASEKRKEREQKQGLLEDQRKHLNVSRFQQQYTKDKVISNAEEALANAEEARVLINTKNPITDQASKRRLARLSGEVGVMTDKDVEDFGGSKALLDRLEQAIQRAYDGTLTDENRRFMMEYVDRVEKRHRERLKDRTEYYAKLGAKRFDTTKEEAMDLIAPGFIESRKNKSSDNKEKPSVGQIVRSKGKMYRILDEEGNLEEIK